MEENPEMPKSRAVGEAAGGLAGMTAGAAIGFMLIRWAIAYGWLAGLIAGAAAVIIFVCVMIGCSILGNALRF